VSGACGEELTRAISQQTEVTLCESRSPGALSALAHHTINLI
jgi:hypothetical protein